VAEENRTGRRWSRRELLKWAGYGGAALAASPLIVNVGRKSMAKAIKDHYAADVLVIGGGLAGLFAALRAADAGQSVILMDKGSVGQSGMSPWAGSVAGFDLERHELNRVLDEVSRDSEYLNDRGWMEVHLRNAGRVLNEFRSWGAMDVATHQRAPILLKQLQKAHVTLIERTMAVSLIKDDQERVAGAMGFAFDDSAGDSRAVVIRAKAVVSCMGAGGVRGPGFPIWSLTHDGDALAYVAGAAITGKEFHDLHPACEALASGALNDPMFKSRTAYLGDEFKGGDGNGGSASLDGCFRAMEGAINADADGHPGALPSPSRDPGAGALGLGCHKGEGLVSTDYTGAADGVPGLFAAGDCLGSMLTGGSTPYKGYSLIGSAVQGDNAGRHAALYASRLSSPTIDAGRLTQSMKELWAPRERQAGYSPAWITQVLQNTIMPYFVTYIKDGHRMQGALTMIRYLREHCAPKLIAKDGHELRQAHELRHMLLNQEMKFRASIFRTESRGSHFREDFPARNDEEWLCWIDIRRDENGDMSLSKRFLPEEWRPAGSYMDRYKRRFPGEEDYLKAHGMSVSV
jgi:succinate dehydrogenase/fumarate reductase flavoprotein subunit